MEILKKWAPPPSSYIQVPYRTPGTGGIVLNVLKCMGLVCGYYLCLNLNLHRESSISGSKVSLTNFHGLKLQHLHIIDVPICVKDNPRVLLFQFSRVSRANRYMLFCDPMFVPPCFKPTQFQGEISPHFGTDQ